MNNYRAIGIDWNGREVVLKRFFEEDKNQMLEYAKTYPGVIRIDNPANNEIIFKR